MLHKDSGWRTHTTPWSFLRALFFSDVLPSPSITLSWPVVFKQRIRTTILLTTWLQWFPKVAMCTTLGKPLQPQGYILGGLILLCFGHPASYISLPLAPKLSHLHSFLKPLDPLPPPSASYPSSCWLAMHFGRQLGACPKLPHPLLASGMGGSFGPHSYPASSKPADSLFCSWRQWLCMAPVMSKPGLLLASILWTEGTPNLPGSPVWRPMSYTIYLTTSNNQQVIITIWDAGRNLWSSSIWARWKLQSAGWSSIWKNCNNASQFYLRHRQSQTDQPFVPLPRSKDWSSTRDNSQS